MARFPSSEMGVVELAQRMVAGLTDYSADFPTVTATSVQAPLDDYMEKKNAYESAKSQVNTTCEEKDAALAMLIDMMKTDLKKAEIDVGSDSPKLTEIGWGPKAAPQPLTPPGQAILPHPIAEGQGMICLQWTRPADGGDVSSYIVERHQQAEGGQWSPWIIAANVYDATCMLNGQPENVRLEYRVKAVNAAGEGAASSIVSVVLP